MSAKESCAKKEKYAIGGRAGGSRRSEGPWTADPELQGLESALPQFLAMTPIPHFWEDNIHTLPLYVGPKSFIIQEVTVKRVPWVSEKTLKQC